MTREWSTQMVTGPLLLVVFVLAIAFLLFTIIKLKWNPFLALLGTALGTALAVGTPGNEIPALISTGFGNTLGSVGIVIGLGIILGYILAESRAINALANGMLRAVGNKNATLAVNTSGWMTGIPVFQDAAFVIFMPLVRQIQRTTKKPLVALVSALGVGTITSHALVIPTPGPTAVAGNMGADIGTFLLYALVVSLPASLLAGVLYPRFLAKRADPNAYLETPVDVVEGPRGTTLAGPGAGTDIGSGSSAPDASSETQVALQDRAEAIDRPEPTMGIAVAVLMFPLLLILVGSITALLLPETSSVLPVAAFLGDKNVALLLGVIVAFVVLRKYFTTSVNDVVIEATSSAGLILLITGAGGALGNVINSSGIGDYLVETMQGLSISLVVLGFLLSQVLRAAQGSTTVALVTTSAILGPLVVGTGVSPVLVGLAICAGGIGLSLPNDSGFWVLSRYSGLTVPDTIRAWTVGGTIAGLTAFAMVLLLSTMPFLPGL